jgi:hypothetical protein
MQTDREFTDALEQIGLQNAGVLKKLPVKKRRAFVRKSMQRSKIVYAIWYVDDERHCYCIKGINQPEGYQKVTAFIVGSVVDAEGMQRDWGDGLSSMH